MLKLNYELEARKAKECLTNHIKDFTGEKNQKQLAHWKKQCVTLLC